MSTNIQSVYDQFVRERFPLPSEADIASLEHRINVHFPPEYRRFLLEFNGGWFREEHGLNLPIERRLPTCLDCLYGIGADHESAELGRRSDMVLFDDNDPPQIIIIGRTLLNELIVLGVHPETYGNIFFKTYAMKLNKTPEEWFYMADSLEEFFGMIVEPETE